MNYVQEAAINPGASFDINIWYKQRGKKEHLLQKISQKAQTKADRKVKLIEETQKTRTQSYLHY